MDWSGPYGHLQNLAFSEIRPNDLINNSVCNSMSGLKHPPTQVRTLKRALFHSFQSIEKLQRHLKEAETSSDWCTHFNLLEEQRKGLESHLSELSPALVEGAKKAIKKLSKRRIRLKFQRAKAQEYNSLMKSWNLRQHKLINDLQKKMRNSADDLKREQYLKSQADLVLCSVKSKVLEARRMISLLNGLAKLRRVRGQNRGELMECKGFAEVIEKLKDYWNEQIKDYNIEERGLTAMLELSKLDQTKPQNQTKKKIPKSLQNWVIFGEESAPFFSLTNLIPIRNEWDAFAVTSEIMTSSIPTSWVFPSAAVDEEWAELLQGM